MRKLLGLLGAFSLTVTASSAVIACTKNERITTPKLNEDLAKKIIAGLVGSDVADIDFGSIFNEGNITEAVVAWINELVSLQYNYETTNRNLAALSLTQYENKKAFTPKFNNLTSIISQDKFFTEYTKSIVPGTQPMDFQISKDLYALNVINDTKVKSFDNKKDINVKKGWTVKYMDGSELKQWEFYNEGGDSNKKTNSIPTIDILTREFDSNNKDAIFYVGPAGEMDKAKNNPITNKTALTLRFQDYFKNNIQKSIINDALTVVYNEASLFSIKKDGDKNTAFIDTTSAVMSKSQTWKDNNEKMKTNVKMVWTATFDFKQKSDVEGTIRSLTDAIDMSNGSLKEGQSIKDLIAKIKELTPSTNTYEDGEGGGGGETDPPAGDDTEAKEKGFDSFLGIDGFNGFIAYNNGSAVGDNPISGAGYEDAIKNYNARGGIIKNGISWTYQNSDANKIDVVFILPVYLIELLGGSDASGKSTYKLTDSKDKTVTVNLGQSSQFKDRYSKIWNNTLNKDLHTKDIQDIAANPEKQEAMFRQIQYLYSKDSANQELAKTVIYSKYLDADDIYHAGLYDAIGVYIKKDDDEDE